MKLYIIVFIYLFKKIFYFYFEIKNKIIIHARTYIYKGNFFLKKI